MRMDTRGIGYASLNNTLRSLAFCYGLNGGDYATLNVRVQMDAAQPTITAKVDQL